MVGRSEERAAELSNTLGNALDHARCCCDRDWGKEDLHKMHAHKARLAEEEVPGEVLVDERRER